MSKTKLVQVTFSFTQIVAVPEEHAANADFCADMAIDTMVDALGESTTDGERLCVRQVLSSFDDADFEEVDENAIGTWTSKKVG